MVDPKSIKLIATDLDGTLLDAEGDLDPRSAAAFRAARAAGRRICVCTGRHWMGARMFARELDGETPVVGVNGALVRNEGRILASRTLGYEYAAETLAVLDSLGLYSHLYVDDHVLSRREELCMDYYARFNAKLPPPDRFELRYEGDPLEALKSVPRRPGPGRGIFKLVCIARSGELGAMEEARARISALGGATMTCSDSGSFELFAEGCSKEAGLALVLGELGLGFESVAALGDQSNDAGMLARAAISIAMGNAIPELLASANFRAGRNTELGAALALRDLALAGAWGPPP